MPDLYRAAEVIRSSWKEGSTVDYVKGDLWPDTIEEGYEIQALLAERRQEPVIGWKIAATAEAGRNHINVDRPMAGRLFNSICHSDGSELEFGHNRMAVAEAEFVFTLGKDLPPRDTAYSEKEVADCIETLHPGLEFPDSRFRDFTLPGTAGLIADNACAANFVLGQPTAVAFDPHKLDVHKTALFINEEQVTNGCGGDVLEGQLSAMAWIANTLSELGVGLTSGQFITTGVTGKPMPITPGDHVRADLGIFGSVSASLV